MAGEGSGRDQAPGRSGPGGLRHRAEPGPDGSGPGSKVRPAEAPFIPGGETGAASALADVVRHEAGLLVTALVRALGDFELAEDAVQDAILEALQHWPADGVPVRPDNWLLATARRKAIDRLRREARYRDKLQLLGRLETRLSERTTTVLDERLDLIFTCCHPALPREAQVALTLRSVLGLTTEQIAKAFLVSDATIAQRIVRAKRKIVDAGIPLRVPSGDDLTSRLYEVLSVVYLMFNEGYMSSGADAPARADLAADAEWLASLLFRSLPDEPEVVGLLALFRLHQARSGSRFDQEGHLVLLQDQDRTLWDHEAICHAMRLLTGALKRGRIGPFQLQAAIAACHASAPTWSETDWTEILALYDMLQQIAPSPVVGLNRAIALAEVAGPERALAEVDALAEALGGYHLFHATRAELLRRLDRRADAAAADRAAVALTRNPAEQHLLRRRIDAGR